MEFNTLLLWWVSFMLTSHLSWVSQISTLCWMSLRWMPLYWVSWYQHFDKVWKTNALAFTGATTFNRTTLSIMLLCCKLSVIYAKCQFCSVANKPIMLSIIMPKCHYVECRYAECRYAKCRGAILLVRDDKKRFWNIANAINILSFPLMLWTNKIERLSLVWFRVLNV